MARYTVTLPITGIVMIEVDADDERSAIDAALSSDATLADIESWETHRMVCEGNVYRGELNAACANVIED